MLSLEIKLLLLSLSTAILLFVTGCGEAPEASAPLPVTPTSHTLEPAEPAIEVADVDREAGDAEEDATEELLADEFPLPFPEREELFRVPNRPEGRAESRGEVGEVALKGFVNTGQPKVLLIVDGQLEALAAGDQRGDLVVIQIAPPEVTLERGRLRWVQSIRAREE